MDLLSSFFAELMAGLVIFFVTLISAQIKIRRTNKKLDLAEKQVAELENRIEVFEPDQSGQYNSRFYEYFVDAFRAAKSNIYLTGLGFNYSSDEGERIAVMFTEGLRNALSNGINVVRLQTTPSAHRKWAEALHSLLRDYPENFELHVLRSIAPRQLASLCVIDPDDANSNIVEFMLEIERLRGTRTTELAGPAVFIRSNLVLAQDIRLRITNQITSDSAFKLTASDDVIRILSEPKYYFSYGSNMDHKQMADRVSSAKFVTVGMLNNHKLVFNRRGTYRTGGVASVVPSDNHRVYGVIWRLESQDFWNLDAKEDPAAYNRTTKLVYSLSGEEFSCEVYEAIPHNENIKADQEYLNLVITAANANQLPEDYIGYLKTFVDK